MQRLPPRLPPAPRRGRSMWTVLAIGVPLAAIVGFATRRKPLRAESAHLEVPSMAIALGSSSATTPPAAPLAGLDLTKVTLGEGGATAPLAEKNVAHLTLDPTLQRLAHGVMAMHRIPEAAVVLMDVATGKILVYASHIEKGAARDLCAEAKAPAASVFKVVTASALVEKASLTPDHRECYSGGEQRIFAQDLVADPKRDRWCTTLAGAMGRSINTVFARLAVGHLQPSGLDETAKALGFGTSLPFDVPIEPSAARFPEDRLGFARTAAGFWNTTLSPLHAAWLSATIARGGEPVRPTIVERVVDERGKVVYAGASSVAQKRAIPVAAADAVTTMMESTVSDGTSYRAFHDPKGAAFLANVSFAGKTGTLTDASTQRYYTWFTGFGPSHPGAAVEGEKPSAPNPPKVAIGVLVVNHPTWTVKANVVAREVLRGYFASHKVPNVTMPQLRAPQPSTTPGTKHRRHRGSYAAAPPTKS